MQHRPLLRPRSGLACLLLALALPACSPTLDWRELSPNGSGLGLSFPCKPDQQTRSEASPGGSLQMGLARCDAAGQSFALAWSEVAEPAQITPALAAMRQSLLDKLGARLGERLPLQLAGMTPNPEASTQLLLAPQRQARLALFTRGQTVYQLLMLGEKPNEAAWQGFLGSVRLQP